MSQRIVVWDSTRREWRQFDVAPPDYSYVVKCGNGLHQFVPTRPACACGAIQR